MNPKIHLTSLFLNNLKRSDQILGEWCKPSSEKKNIPYHWDNYERMHTELKLVDQIYEELLEQITLILNDYHGIFLPKKSWRIFIGTWLYSFLHTIYERYKIINFAEETRNLFSSDLDICWLNFEEQDFQFISSYSSCDAMRKSDFVNQFLFQELISNLKQQNFKKVLFKSSKKFVLEKNSNPNFKSSKGAILILNLLSNIKKFLSLFNLYKVITSNTYLSKKEDLFLSFKNKSIYLPGFINDIHRPSCEINFDNKLRSNLKDALSLRLRISNIFNENFSYKTIDLFSYLLFKFIPANFLENFKDLYKKAIYEKWIYKKSYILTACSYGSNDLFCMRAALAASYSRESKLFILQHGGNFGTAKINSSEKHQRKISSKYFTWGWKEDNKTIPLGVVKKLKKYNPNSYKSKEILLITMELCRYSYFGFSGPHGPQWLDYQVNLENAAKVIASNKFDLTIRTKPKGDSWLSQERWENLSYKLDQKKSFHKSCSDSKLVISTYNAATFLETFNMDIPTLIFWDPKMWALREDAKDFFEDLKEVDIFHTNINSLKETLIEARCIGYYKWWKKLKRRSVLKNFVNNYCNKNNDPISIISKYMK